MQLFFVLSRFRTCLKHFGGSDHISGAIAEADALGTFATYGIYMVTLWLLSEDISYQLSAIDLYTNYDGAGASFGDTLVTSSTSDQERASCYAAIDSENTSSVNLVLTNKSMTDNQIATITLNSDVSYSSVAVYGITEESSEIQMMQAVNKIADNTFTIELPPLSVVQIAVSTDAFTLMGDVNDNGMVNDAHAVRLQDYLVSRNDAVIAPVEYPVGFTQSEPGK